MIHKSSPENAEKTDTGMKTLNSDSCIKARTTLWYLSFTGFAVNYVVRINLNLAIVSMIKTPKSAFNDSLEIVQHDPERQLIYDDTYEWTVQQQNVILGAFFWLHWSTGLLGGFLAHRYGTKHIFGLGNFIPTILCFLIPAAAALDYRLVVVIRVLQGLFTGICWPAMNCVVSKWIPPHERSRFLSSFYGSSVGTGFTYIMAGFIIDHLGWKYVFYINGIVCTVWYVLWCYLAYDTPQQHPRISREEFNYITERTKESTDGNRLPIPWKKIFKSKSLWIATYTYWGILWSIVLLQTYMPLYFKVIHQLDPEQIGIVLLWPNITKWLFSFLLGMLVDRWIEKRTLSTTNARKLAVTLSTSIQAVVLIALATIGNGNAAVAVLAVTLAITLQGATSSGILTTFIDMSPNFSSILYGICNTVACTSGFIIPYIISVLLQYGEPEDQWKSLLLIVVAILIVTNFMFVFFGESKLEEWNSACSKSEQNCEVSNNQIKINIHNNNNNNHH